jgi:thioredoxin-related protein
MAPMIRVAFILFLLLSFGNAISAQVNWLTWEEAQAKNKVEPRKFIVDVYTQWCGWCKKMDKATFQQSEIASYINKNYYAIKFDAETKTDINFKEKPYKYVRQGTSGYHQLAAEITFGKLSFPTIVFLDEQLNVIQPIPGYKDPASLDKIMKYFAEDYYKTTPWKKYEQMCPSSTPSTAPPVMPIKGNQE